MTKDPKIIANNYAYEFFCELNSKLLDSVSALELSKTEEEHANEAILALSDHTRQKDGGFDFRNITSCLYKILEHCRIDKLYIALDEFVAIPIEAQPYFAHHLKLVFSSDARFVLKITCVTHQVALSAHVGPQQIGLEIGADVFGDIDLDRYFLIDENGSLVQEFLSQVLYNHLAESLTWDTTHSPAAKYDLLTSTFFTQSKVFIEMARACEGNCRDLMNIFKQAYFEFKKTDSVRIGIDHILTAVRSWFQTAKLQNLSPTTKDEEFLRFIIQDVISTKKSRHFMVSVQDSRHPLINRLLNFRLLHRMTTSWSHPDRPGEQYHIFSIDYGCFVDLRGIRAELNQLIFHAEGMSAESFDDLVPLADRRSIRRIVIEKGDLDKYNTGPDV